MSVDFNDCSIDARWYMENRHFLAGMCVCVCSVWREQQVESSGQYVYVCVWMWFGRVSGRKWMVISSRCCRWVCGTFLHDCWLTRQPWNNLKNRLVAIKNYIMRETVQITGKKVQSGFLVTKKVSLACKNDGVCVCWWVCKCLGVCKCGNRKTEEITMTLSTNNKKWVFEQILSTFRSSSATNLIATPDCLTGSFSLKTPISKMV